MLIVILMGIAGSILLAWGIGLMIDSITNTSWDITWHEFAEWLSNPKFLRGLGMFLASFLVFGLTFLFAVVLLS